MRNGNGNGKLFTVYNHIEYPMAKKARLIIDTGTIEAVIQVIVETPNKKMTRSPQN